MLSNYLKTALRNLVRNRFYALVNVVGLAISLSVSLLIVLYVMNELSFDEFHSLKNSIYRIAFIDQQPNETSTHCISMPVMGPDIAAEFPEVREFVRFRSPEDGFFSFEDLNIHATNVTYADSAVFRVFSFPLLSGNPQAALREPFTVVLTRSLARKLFGDSNPLGQVVRFNQEEPLRVTGVMQDFPPNSHLQFSAMISFSTLYQTIPAFHFNWNGGWNYYTYFLLQPNTDVSQLEKKLGAFFDEKLNRDYEKIGWRVTPFLQALTHIYLDNSVSYDLPVKGNPQSIYIFSLVAILILFLAGANFTNLSSALSIKRIKEIGIRKASGASNFNIRFQFLSEAVLVSFMAFILAMILIEILLPQFNQMMGKDLEIYTRGNIPLLLIMPFFVFLLGILSGTYPALFITRKSTELSLKGKSSHHPGRLSVSNLLVLIQFFISVGLILSSFFIYRQLRYIEQRDPGFNNHQVMAVPLNGTESTANRELLKERISGLTGVEKLSLGSNYPGNGIESNGYFPEGSEKPIMFHVLYVDEDYLSTLKFHLIQGRDFNPALATDAESCIVNEELVRQAGWQDALGKTIERNERYYKVIGVVKDFNFSPVYQPIEPLLFLQTGNKRVMLIRFAEGREIDIAGVGRIWKELTRNEPFEYTFLDDQYHQVYQADIQFGNLILALTILAIFIAALGILALSTLSTEMRTREMGIRKVMGAGPGSIVRLVGLQYSRWVVLANVFAWPIVYFLMDRWLDQFAYRIGIGFFPFLASGLLSLLVAFLAISIRALKVSRVRPVNTLRYE